jgi:beta-galactosidase
MRERLLLDRNWRFALGHAANPALDFGYAGSRDLVKAGEAGGAPSPKFDDGKWKQVDLPHDWAIELPLDPAGDTQVQDHGFNAIGPAHPENSVGWYRRTFTIPAEDLGRRLSLEFDGVYRDSIVWLNGFRLGRHESGYTGFAYDISDVVNYGGTNTLCLRVNATDWEGWWYEGAGIYRHVWLVKTHALHVARFGTHVVCDVPAFGPALVNLTTTVANDDATDCEFTLSSTVISPDGKRMKLPPLAGDMKSWDRLDCNQTCDIDRPKLWSCEQPNLYTLETELWMDGQAVDTYQTTFGIRTTRWDAAKGFFLNGRPLKIRGTCNHQNHAGVGTAMADRLHEWRIEKLKAMGSNAFRCSHYAVTPELLDICDRLGMLVLAENRLAGDVQNLQAMVKRDRNHPSIIAWSLANEEHTVQWSITGERLGRTMIRAIKALDPTRKITTAMHDRGLGEGFANVVDVHGWNYIKVGDIEAFHARRPEQPILGSEEGSTLFTRGVYADDPSRAHVSAYDIRTPKWGSTAEHWWTFFAEREWLAGGFVWTGFDYRGEPIPYKWPATSSQFGIMDLCGFPKDIYWYYKSWWGSEPVLHLFPHWNWPGKEGREIDVRCFTNAESIELFLNGRSLGHREVARNSHAAWKVIYEPGRLEARAGKFVSIVETTGHAERIVLEVDRPKLKGDGEDIAVVSVSTVDKHGRHVPTADHLIRFEVTGGKLLGVGNGDPGSHESDKAPFRKLFSGRAMTIVQALGEPGEISVIARSEALAEASLTIPVTAAEPRPSA